MPKHSAREQANQCRELFAQIAEEVIDFLESTLAAVAKGDTPENGKLISREHGIALSFLDLNLRCLNLLAMADTGQSELQVAGSIMSAAMELEQVNDLTRHIVERQSGIGGELYQSFAFTSIGNLTALLVTRSVDAFLNRNQKAMEDVSTIESELDDMHRQLHENAIALMQASIFPSGELLSSRSLSMHLERIARHAAGIKHGSDAAFFPQDAAQLPDLKVMMMNCVFSKN